MASIDQRGVERALAITEQKTPLGDLVGERVLEGVFETGERAGLVQELCGLEMSEPAPEFLLGEPRDHVKEGKGARPSRPRQPTGGGTCPRVRAGRCGQPGLPARLWAPGCLGGRW